MKVILLENVRKIGSIGDIINVKRGFARNYLISKKKALFASKENVAEVEKIKQDLNKKDLERKKNAKETRDKLQNKEYSVKKLSTENKELYGSVKPTEISKILKISESLNKLDHKKIAALLLDQANILDGNILSNPTGYIENLTELFIS